MFIWKYSLQCKKRVKINAYPVLSLVSSKSFKPLWNLTWNTSNFGWYVALQDLLISVVAADRIHLTNPFQSKSSEPVLHSQAVNYASGQLMPTVQHHSKEAGRGQSNVLQSWRQVSVHHLVFWLAELCSASVITVWSWFPAFTIKSWEIRFITKGCPWKFFEALTTSCQK